jgi:tetratricopeptide (TPR) repeat protein
MMNNTIKLLKSFLEMDPTDSFTHFALAMEYSKTGDFQQSEIIFKKLVETDPGYLGTYYHLGKLLQNLGKSDEAKFVFKNGILIAQNSNDQHTASELKQALLELDF